MTEYRNLLELGNKLLAHAESSLLDTRLDALSGDFEDDEVGALLTAAFEAGEADCLRQLLRDDVFPEWLEQTVTASEAQRLQHELARLLGVGALAGDDPERLSQLPPLPQNQAALAAWAEEFDVVEVLREPMRKLVPDASPYAGELTVSTCALGDFDRDLRRSSLAQQQRLTEAAQSRLTHLAAQRAALSARSSLWRQPPPDGPLRALTERLRAMVQGVSLSELMEYRFLKAHPVRLELASGVAHARFRAQLCEEGIPVLVDLHLSGFEHRNVGGTCSDCAAPSCMHRTALAARLLDACLSTQDRLHAPLRELTAIPSWKRVLEELTAQPTKPAAHEARILFQLRITEGALQVGVLVQKESSTSRNASFKLTSAQQLLRRGRVRDEDRPVLEALLIHSRTLSPQFIAADLSILRALSAHPFVVRENLDDFVQVSESTLRVELLEQPDGLLPRVSLDDAPVKRAPKPNQPYILRDANSEGRLVFAAVTPPLRRLLATLSHFGGVFPEASYPMLAPWIKSLSHIAEVHTPRALDGYEEPTPRTLLLRIVPGLQEGIDVCVGFRALPLGALLTPGHGPDLVHGLRDGKPVHARRDLAWERKTSEQVIETLALRDQLRLDPFRYRIEKMQDTLEVLSRIAKLTDSVSVEWAENAVRLTINGTARTKDLKVELFKKGQWFSVQGGIAHGEVMLGVTRLLEAARLGERFVEVSRGTYIEIERELFDRLNTAQLCAHRLRGSFEIPQAALPAYIKTLGDQSEGADAESRDWLRRLTSERRVVDEADLDLSELGVTLRPYQRTGLGWLCQMADWAPGACLADDMGLGKTLQASALLARRRSLGPAMVVAPTSLLDNWHAELTRSSRALSVHVYRGDQRKLQVQELGPGDVVVLSYDTLLRDMETFEKLHVATQVIDEAQVIKNARTLRAQAVASVSADFRLALSGTPIENRLGDLWSLMELIAPGLLGSWDNFRARFATPIERYEDMERAALLKSLVAPFFLRRTKREVESDLPQRTEVTCLVEFSQAERDLYDAAVHEARRAIGKRSRHDAQRSVQILAELTRLRQLACHPRLVLSGEENTSSAKLERLLLLLQDILPRRHRALIFSQFTQHLQLVRQALEMQGISTLYLDGATKGSARSGLVAQFQAGVGQVFLISLKAGGTGLNLTEADYVIHLDPWWNPAAEDQASDRAHRLGQTRPVTVVKLVTQGTIEEKVLALHAHKRRLADAVLLGEARAVSLDTQTLMALLQN